MVPGVSPPEGVYKCASVYKSIKRTGEFFAAPGSSGFSERHEQKRSDYEDDNDEEDLRQGYPHPLFKPSRRPKAGKHWVISMFNPSHKPSQGVPDVPRTQAMLRE